MMADAPGDPTNFALIAMRNESTVVAGREARAIELITQVVVNVDYTLMFVQQVREARGNGTDREVMPERSAR